MTTSDEIGSQPRIGTLVSRVFSSFQSLLSALHLQSPEGAVVVSHLARFKLWVGTLGAHRLSGSRSLEYRLRDASSIKNHVVTLLRDLCDSVDEVANGATEEDERDDSGGGSHDDGADESATAELEAYFRDDDTRGASELSRVLQEVGHTIDCLLRLSITIRNPAPHDHFRSRAGVELVDLYEPWDVKHAREKFPNADPGITERLGKATSRRRQYFKYREEHAGKLAEGLDEPGPETSEEKATTVASSIPHHLKSIDMADNLAEFDDSESNVSQTSYSPSSSDDSLLRVPPLPKESLDGPFKCPFCCMIVSIHTRNDWKKHVFRDLRPYVCLSGSCATPERQYLRRGDWINHMKQDHWRTWRCPFACPQLFPTKFVFVAHIQEFHAAEAPAQNIDTLENLSSQLDLEKAKGGCPLCTAFMITSDEKYGSHVAEHLEQLALFALPGVAEGGDAGDDDGTNVNEDVDAEESLQDEKLSAGSAWDAFDPDTYRGDVDSRSDEGSDSGYADLRLRDAPLSLGAQPAKADGPGEPELSGTEASLFSRSPVSSPAQASNLRHSSPDPPSIAPDDDVLRLKYRDAIFPEQFPAYSIGDGNLLVGDVVDRAALVLGLDSTYKKHIILLYKGHRLVGLGSPIREYGVKNQSELLVVLGDKADGDTEVRTTEEDEALRKAEMEALDEIRASGRRHIADREERQRGRRAAGKSGKVMEKIDGIVKHYKEEILPQCEAYIATPPPPSWASAYDYRRLTDMIKQQVLSPLRAETESLADVNADVQAAHQDAMNQAQEALGRLSFKNADNERVLGQTQPSSGSAEIAAIMAHFKTGLRPRCEDFIARPPSGKKDREHLHTILSNDVKQQIIWMLDQVEGGGGTSIAAQKEEAIGIVRNVLERMDRVGTIGLDG